MDESKTNLRDQKQQQLNKQIQSKKQRKLIRSPEATISDLPASVIGFLSPTPQLPVPLPKVPPPVVPRSPGSDVMGGGFGSPQGSLVASIPTTVQQIEEKLFHFKSNFRTPPSVSGNLLTEALSSSTQSSNVVNNSFSSDYDSKQFTESGHNENLPENESKFTIANDQRDFLNKRYSQIPRGINERVTKQFESNINVSSSNNRASGNISSVRLFNKSSTVENYSDTSSNRNLSDFVMIRRAPPNNLEMGADFSVMSSNRNAISTGTTSDSSTASTAASIKTNLSSSIKGQNSSTSPTLITAHSPSSVMAASALRLQNFICKSNNELPSQQHFHHSPNHSQQDVQQIQQTFTAQSDHYSSDYYQPQEEQKQQKEYYYRITSPNNPFLPEIITRNYECDDRQFSLELRREDSEEDRNLESLENPIRKEPGRQSELYSPGDNLNYHRYSQGQQYQEQSYSDQSQQPKSLEENSIRGIFTLNSPIREHRQQKEIPVNSDYTIGNIVGSKSSEIVKETVIETVSTEGNQQRTTADGNVQYHSQTGSGGVNHLFQQKQQLQKQTMKKSSNPFLCQRSNSPTTDLNAKREQFLKATMKICLVVSPPSSKLQLKSKSLTHLDTLDSLIACHQDGMSEHQTSEHSDASSPQPPHSPQQQKLITVQQYNLPESVSATPNAPICNKICCLGSTAAPATVGASSSSVPANLIHSSNSIGNSSGGSLTATNLSTSPQAQGSVQKKKSSFMNRKKPLFTRSEVSSSEYFSVQFCIENGVQDEEFIPATKGITLSEALGDILKKRKLTFSQINISDNNFHNFFESGSPPYLSSLDECTDVENLAGKVLVITEKEGLKKTNTLQKAASFGSRTRPPRLLSSASTEETIDSDQKAIPGKQLKQRWSGLFGIKNPQQSQLCELLNNYAKNGVPQKMSSLNFDHPDFEAALEYLDKIHKSWKDFIRYDEMGENEMKVQTAIWELVTTEVDYIHALQTVTDLFLACLEAIQEEKLLTDIDQNKLFSNIRDICAANLKFWALYLYPMVANSIVNNNPMCIDYFQPGFVTFATTFAPYKKYCAEQSTCQFYCKELNRNNALFTAYLAWCESQKMCNRLRLADILVRPMQRLTKYSLLLAAIRKHIIDENDADIMDSMIHSVENFVCSVNTHLTTRQENERLKGIMARIESYDIVDLNNEHLEKLVKQYCTILDLCSPMKGCASNQGRHLFMEGDLKLKDNQGKLDVHCFLLTDILLICKTIAKKGQGTLKVIRQPYLTDRLIVKHKDNTLYCIYLNEFQMAISAFTLQCAEAKSWNDSITKAKHIYSRLKQGSHWDGYTLRTNNNNNVNNNNISNCINNSGQNSVETLGVKKSPLNSSIGSRVSSLNNSHSGSVELNDSRNISVDFEKTNSLSSDEGSMISTNNSVPQKPKTLAASPHKQLKVSTSNTLVVQPLNSLGQSLPNLNLHQSQSSNNTLLVPGVSSHSGNVLLSPSHRGISYPPPSPTRATLRRGFAFSSSIKNPPLVKTRNITSQSSINWPQQSPTTGPIAGSCLINSQQQQQQQSISSQQQQRQQSSPVPMGKDSLKINNESDV